MDQERAQQIAEDLALRAAHFLYEGNETEALQILLRCSVEFRAEGDFSSSTNFNFSLPDRVFLGCSRADFDLLSNEMKMPREHIVRAFNVAAQSRDEHCKSIEVIPRYEPQSASRRQKWHEEALAALPGAEAMEAVFTEEDKQPDLQDK